MQRTLVVTGGAGFVGVNFTRYAHQKGYRVIIIDTEDRLHRLESMEIFPDPRLVFLPLNLAADQTFPEEEVDALLHFAALPHVEYSLYYPEQVVVNNTLAFLKTLEAVRQRKIPTLFISSIEVYGGNEGEIFRENDANRPLSPYAASKVACEAILQSYMASLGLTGGIARLTNLYGPWQAPDRIIPRLITQILAGYPCEVEGERVRDFLYVEDAIKALLKIVEDRQWGEVFNVSSGRGYNNYQLISLLQETVKETFQVSYIDAKRIDGRGKSLVSSPQKLQEASGWNPSVSLQDGIKLTYEWYAAHPHWWRQFEENIRAERITPRFLTDYTRGL